MSGSRRWCCCVETWSVCVRTLSTFGTAPALRLLLRPGVVDVTGLDPPWERGREHLRGDVDITRLSIAQSVHTFSTSL